MLLLAVQLLIIARIACDWTGFVMAIARSVRTSLMRAIDFFTCQQQILMPCFSTAISHQPCSLLLTIQSDSSPLELKALLLLVLSRQIEAHLSGTRRVW